MPVYYPTPGMNYGYVVIERGAFEAAGFDVDINPRPLATFGGKSAPPAEWQPTLQHDFDAHLAAQIRHAVTRDAETGRGSPD